MAIMESPEGWVSRLAVNIGRAWPQRTLESRAMARMLAVDAGAVGEYHNDPHGVQHLLGRAVWDTDGVRQHVDD